VPTALPAEVRAAALARLASIMRGARVGRREEGFRRARRIAPAVYRTAGLPPDAEPSGVGEPADRDGRAPGPGTAAVLDRAVPGGLSSHDLLEGVAGWEQLISWAHARQAEMVAEFARRRPGPYAPDEAGRSVSEFAADEIAARLRISQRAAELKLSLAVGLADRLPATAAALREGRIDLGKAKPSQS
jgi:hypothetical protein